MKSICIILFVFVAAANSAAVHLENLPLPLRVAACLIEAAPVKCVATTLGNSLDGAKTKVEGLLETGSQDVKDFFHEKGDQVKEAIKNSDPYFQQAKAKVNELKEKAQTWWDSHFGSGDRSKRQIPSWFTIPLHVRVQLCLQDTASVKDKIGCVAANLGSDLAVAKDKVEALLKTAPQEIKEFFTEKGDQIKEAIKNKDAYFQQAKDKVNELKEKAQTWWDSHFGGERTKRDIPTQSDINLAQRIKFCMEKNGETDLTNCMSKVLGSKAQDYDIVKIQTIINYEAVLAELKQFFEEAKAHGKTPQEYLAYKKAQRTKRDIPVVTRVQECLKTQEDKNAAECVADVLGSDLVVAKDKVEALLKTAPQQIKDFLQAKGAQIKDIIENRQAYFEKAKEKATELKNDAIKLEEAIKACLQSSDDKSQCVANALGFDLNAATAKVQGLLQSTSQQIKDFFKTKGEQVKTIIENKQSYFDKAKEEANKLKDEAKAKVDELKNKAQTWWDEHFGDKRAKRDIPTQSEINLAQRIKFCMEKNGETDLTNCMAKILGSKAQDYDAVKLQTIINYEAVLAELKEFFKAAAAAGKTPQEYLASKKAVAAA